MNQLFIRISCTRSALKKYYCNHINSLDVRNHKNKAKLEPIKHFKKTISYMISTASKLNIKILSVRLVLYN